MAPIEVPITRNDGQSEPEASDASLLSVFRKGNQDAATQIYLRYAKRLRACQRAMLERIVQACGRRRYRPIGLSDLFLRR